MSEKEQVRAMLTRRGIKFREVNETDENFLPVPHATSFEVRGDDPEVKSFMPCYLKFIFDGDDKLLDLEFGY